MLIVQKYGGTSIGDSSRMQTAARRVALLARQGAQMVVVVSAQGDTTDLMIEKAAQVTADTVFGEFPAVTECEILIKKPEAPIKADFSYVGVEIRRKRNG